MPDTVVELDVDTAFERHRWRHSAWFIRVRADLQATDVRAEEDRRVTH